MSEEHLFAVSSSWDPRAREGELANGARTFATRFAGAPSLGGKDGLVNPEELLLSAVESCFVQTWAIFLGKLKVPIEKPTLEGRCQVDKDPAGGYRIVKVELFPHVPRELLESRREDVEKTLALAEKYCIVSKVVRGEGRTLEVSPKPV